MSSNENPIDVILPICEEFGKLQCMRSGDDELCHLDKLKMNTIYYKKNISHVYVEVFYADTYEAWNVRLSKLPEYALRIFDRYSGLYRAVIKAPTQ